MEQSAQETQAARIRGVNLSHPDLGSSKTDVITSNKQEQFKKAINTKNPLDLPTFEERGISVQAKLLRLYENKDYQNLKPLDKIKVRYGIYQNFVLPSYKAAGLEPPDIATWLHGTVAGNQRSATFSSYDMYAASKSDSAAMDVMLGGLNRYQKLLSFGLKYTGAELMQAVGLGHILAAVTPIPQSLVDSAAKGIDKIYQRATNSVQDGLMHTNFLLATHPREGFLANAPRWTGEQIVSLPFYEAVGAGLSGIAPKSIALGTESGAATKGIQNLSKTLATSKIGNFVGNRLYSASTVFLSSVVTGDSPREATSNTAGVVALETAGAAVASNPLIKKFTANILAMGGRPLAEQVATTALAEATLGRVDTEATTNTAFGGRVVETRIPKSDGKGFKPGYFDLNGERFHYNTAEERLATYDKVEAQLKSHREQTDPVLHKVMEAEKLSAESIALRNFAKPLASMTPEEIGHVLQRRMELIAEAEYELPAHVPDLNKMTVEQENAKDFVEHPIAGNFAARLKQLGVDMTQINSDAQVQAIEEQTGIKSSKGTVAKIDKMRKSPKEITSGSASLSPEDFQKHRDSSIAYFKNPNKQRLASDGTIIGARDKRTWNERLKAENTQEFIQTLKDADGDRIQFENPYHRMLFHWSNRESLPVSMRQKLLREMKKIVETGAHPRYNMTAADFSKEADWLLVHATAMAQSGRLTKEGNIFASSKFGGPENWTPWQAELQTEVDKQELKTLNTLVQRHPEAKKAIQVALKKMQMQRMNAKTPDEWLQYNAAVNQYLKLGIF